MSVVLGQISPAFRFTSPTASCSLQSGLIYRGTAARQMFKEATVLGALNPMEAARSKAYSGTIGTEMPQAFLSRKGEW